MSGPLSRRHWLAGASGALASLSIPQTAAAQTTGTPKVAPLRLGYLPIINCAAVFLARSQGIFEQHGVQVELVRSAGGERVMAGLREGSIDVGFSNVASMLFAADEGAAVRSLTGGAMSDVSRPVHGVFVRADSGVQTVAELRGQRIAVNTVKAIDEVMLSALIERQGGQAASNRFVPIHFPAMQPALLAGGVDAMVVIEPFVALASLDERLRHISTLYAELQPVTEISAFVSRPGLNLVAGASALRLRAALQEAARRANAQPELVRELLPEYVPVSRRALQRAVLPHFMKRQLDGNALDSTIKHMRAAGWIHSDLRSGSLLHAGELQLMNNLGPRWQVQAAPGRA